MKSKSFLVIGLGRFGTAVAQELAEMGNEVLALDENQEHVQHVADSVTQAVTGDAREESVLRSVGARNFDVAIVAVASDLEASILITVLLKEMGVPQIVAKAQSAIHARVLERVGADQVILPEREMGQRLAQRLAMTNVVDFIGVSDDFTIVEIHTPAGWGGHSLRDLNVRARHNINVLAVRDGANGKVNVTPAADRVIEDDDVLIVIGTNEAVKKVVEMV